MFFKKYLTMIIISLLFIGCTTTEENQTQKPPKEIPKTIKMLFVTQPHCPSCDRLEETMKLKKPNKLIKNYFTLEKVYLGERLPDNLIPPNGTPTVYFLGHNDMALLEPMVGEKDEEGLMMFLEDALLEFKTAYGVDLVSREQNAS